MEINLREICAVNKYAASSEATRYYLNGVFVHSKDDGYVYFVATDGHRMIVYRKPNTDGVNWSFIIPRTALEKFKFSKRDAGTADLDFRDGHVVIMHDGAETRVLPVDGTFPDYARVRPVDYGEISPAVFNGQYCADFDAFAKVLGSSAQITPRGSNAALVTFGHRDDVYGALMPRRLNGSPFAQRAPF